MNTTPTTQMLSGQPKYHLSDPKYYESDPLSFQKQGLVVICQIIFYPSELSPVFQTKGNTGIIHKRGAHIRCFRRRIYRLSPFLWSEAIWNNWLLGSCGSCWYIYRFCNWTAIDVIRQSCYSHQCFFRGKQNQLDWIKNYKIPCWRPI